MRPYWQSSDGRAAIYHGDCREILPSLAPVNVVLTDPPFYLPARISTSRRTWPRKLSEVGVMESYFRDAFDAAIRPLAPTGAFYTFSDSISYAVFLSLLYPRFHRTQCIVWDKGQAGMGNGWRHSTEFILHGAFSETAYAPIYRRDLLTCPVVPSAQRDHASEKPVSLLRQILEMHPTGTVLDPYMGVGSVLVAAGLGGHCAIGIETEEADCEIAAKRLEGPPLLAAMRPQQAALFEAVS